MEKLTTLSLLIFSQMISSCASSKKGNISVPENRNYEVEIPLEVKSYFKGPLKEGITLGTLIYSESQNMWLETFESARFKRKISVPSKGKIKLIAGIHFDEIQVPSKNDTIISCILSNQYISHLNFKNQIVRQLSIEHPDLKIIESSSSDGRTALGSSYFEDLAFVVRKRSRFSNFGLLKFRSMLLPNGKQILCSHLGLGNIQTVAKLMEAIESQVSKN